jgi:hypothetical protein
MRQKKHQNEKKSQKTHQQWEDSIIVLALVKNVSLFVLGYIFGFFPNKIMFLTHAKDFCEKRALICLILKY